MYNLHFVYALECVCIAWGVYVCLFDSGFGFFIFFPRLHPCCVVKRLCKIKVNLLSYSNFKNIYGVAKSLNIYMGYGAVFEIISLDYVRFRKYQRMIQTDVIT